MITNERQRRITAAQIKRFEDAIARAQAAGAPDDVDPLVYQAMIAGMESQLGDLRTELREYERLRSGKVKSRVLSSLLDLPKALIEGRIASGLTQKQLAQKLSIPEQQIQRYEQTRYGGVTIERLQQVVDALGLTIQKRIDYRAQPRGLMCDRHERAKRSARAGASSKLRATVKAGGSMRTGSTGRAAASAAGKILASPSASKRAKSIAASDLAQVGNRKVTGKKAASAAGKTLRSKRSSKATRKVAASDLSQAARKKRA